MSRSQIMYYLKPIITHTDKISLPKCMFKVKNMNGNTISHEGVKDGVTRKNLDISDQVNIILKRPLSGMAELESQQIKLLQQIQELRAKIGASKAKLILKTTQSKDPKKIDKIDLINVQKINNIKIDDLCDLVINVSPSYIPYSLLAIQKLWKCTVQLVIDSYIHSTVKSLPEDLQKFISLITKRPDGNAKYKLYITLIWKDVGPDTELVTSPTACVPIRGEVNILRYLTRIVPTIIEYENNDKVNEIDSLLDSCYRLTRYRTVKERQAIIRQFNAKLGKSHFICGTTEVTVADVAIGSVFKQVDTGSDLTLNFTKYLQRCDTILGY